MAGEMDKAKGKLKDAVGKAADDERLQSEGKADQAAGTAKDKVDKAADWVKDKLD